jgi:transposase
MGTFVGLDVSLKATSICVLDDAGTRVFEADGATDPAVLARLVRNRAPEVVRFGLASGPASAWLFHTLTAARLPAVCPGEGGPMIEGG